jgi:dTDP-4-dehydrorhamnose reductase
LSAAQRVMLVGAGQVGTACLRSAPSDIQLCALAHADLEIADAARVRARVEDFAPDLLINAAAYTAVDKAESDTEAASSGNHAGAANLAAAVARLPNARMIHLSTDFVFDGRASSPYPPDAATGPINVYGATKLAGEQAVRGALGERATIVRTAWVYSSTGNNFVRTMLKLMARGPVRVIADQVGTPTAVGPLADVLWRFAGAATGGTFHWTDAGVASWYDFAVAIAEEAVAARLLPAGVEVTPIATHEFPTAARRPAYSVLDKSETTRRLGVVPRHWRVCLREVLGEMQRA